MFSSLGYKSHTHSCRYTATDTNAQVRRCRLRLSLSYSVFGFVCSTSAMEVRFGASHGWKHFGGARKPNTEYWSRNWETLDVECWMSRANALIYRFGPGYLIKIMPGNAKRWQFLEFW